MGCIHKRDELVSCHTAPARDGDRTCNGAVEVLMVVDDLSRGERGDSEESWKNTMREAQAHHE
jgi:hypothetical protein